jgi:hypothetical protein
MSSAPTQLRYGNRKTLQHFEGERVVMISFEVMPNHVRAVFVQNPKFLLEKLIRSWKGFSARVINKLLGRAASRDTCSARSNHRMERLQVGILLGEIPERAVHPETDLEVCLGVEDVAEEGFVAPHVVVINWLFQERDRPGGQELLRFGGFAKLVQAKPGMKKTGAGVGRDTTKLLADAKGKRPSLFPHQMMEAELKDFGAVLITLLDRVEFGERLARHAQLCVAAGGLQLPFKLHPTLFSTSLAKGCRALPQFPSRTSGEADGETRYGRSVSSSVSRRSKSRSVLSIGAEVVISTPAARRVSSGNFEPPDPRKPR